MTWQDKDIIFVRFSGMSNRYEILNGMPGLDQSTGLDWAGQDVNQTLIWIRMAAVRIRWSTSFATRQSWSHDEDDEDDEHNLLIFKSCGTWQWHVRHDRGAFEASVESTHACLSLEGSAETYGRAMTTVEECLAVDPVSAFPQPRDSSDAAPLRRTGDGLAEAGKAVKCEVVGAFNVGPASGHEKDNRSLIILDAVAATSLS
jgi:hypothetical protein